MPESELGKARIWVKRTLDSLSSVPLISDCFTAHHLTSLLRAWIRRQPLHTSGFFGFFLMGWGWGFFAFFLFYFWVKGKKSPALPIALTASGQVHPESPSGRASQAPGPTLLVPQRWRRLLPRERSFQIPPEHLAWENGVSESQHSSFFPLSQYPTIGSHCLHQVRSVRKHKYCSDWLPPSTSIKSLAGKWSLSIDCLQGPISSGVEPAEQDICPRVSPPCLWLSTTINTLLIMYAIVYNPPFGNSVWTVSCLLSWLV